MPTSQRASPPSRSPSKPRPEHKPHHAAHPPITLRLRLNSGSSETGDTVPVPLAHDAAAAASVGVDASGDDGATKDLCLLVTTEISKIADPADHSTNLKCRLRGFYPAPGSLTPS